MNKLSVKKKLTLNLHFVFTHCLLTLEMKKKQV
jgi:hypothetical protein